MNTPSQSHHVIFTIGWLLVKYVLVDMTSKTVVEQRDVGFVIECGVF